MAGKQPSDVTAPVVVGASMLREIAAGAAKKDSYQPNDLPPIDESLHTDEMIESLQKRSMQLD
jgi:hypothetical protein